MPAKQPKKGKGKKVTVVPDPTSAPANPEVQAATVLDAHIANYFPIPYTLTPPDAESFPQLPPLRQPLEAALFGKWDQPGNPYLVWRIDATRVNFALTRGVLSRFCCAVMGRYPTTLAVELKLSQVTLEGLNKTLKLCTAAASKEFVNVLAVQEKPPKGPPPRRPQRMPASLRTSTGGGSPPPRGDRPVPRALHGRRGGVLVRCAGRRVRAGATGCPHGLDDNGPLHAAPELPGRRDVGPRPRGQGTPHHLLLRREGVPARCFACTRSCHTSHAFGARQILDWRANFAVGARQFPSWRAPTHRLARAE